MLSDSKQCYKVSITTVNTIPNKKDQTQPIQNQIKTKLNIKKATNSKPNENKMNNHNNYNEQRYIFFYI